jgi:predicted O-methyltransferase YrrM
MWRFFRHLLTAGNTGGHGVHSPFLFDFVKNVIYEKHPYYVYSDVERLRKNMLADKQKIYFEDYGTGKNRYIAVSEIAAKSVKKRKCAQLIYRIANFTKPYVVLELGTSLGITTSYLSAVSGNCITIEGCEAVAEIAKQNLKELKRSNIRLVTGDITSVLPDIVEQAESLDLVFIDANHTSMALKAYFDICMTKIKPHSVMIIDDIHYSKDMEDGWNYINQHAEVRVTMDLYELGIVFFRPDLGEATYKLLF